MKQEDKHTSFSREQRLLNHLLLHCADIPSNIGLFSGMTGYAVALASYSRLRSMRKLELVVETLIDNVFAGVSDITPPGLAHGLAGIGWGIEYLIQNRFIDACGAEILQALDLKLMMTDPMRITDENLERGLEGIMHYVVTHVEGARQQGKEVFDCRYLDSLIQRASHSSNPETHRLADCITGGMVYNMDPYAFIATGKSHALNSINLKDLSLADGVAGELLSIINRKGGKHA